MFSHTYTCMSTTHQIGTCQNEPSLGVEPGSLPLPSHHLQASVPFLNVSDGFIYLATLPQDLECHILQLLCLKWNNI